MTRIYNFGAGPAMLPEAVMQQAQAEFCDWRGLGMSVLEISHRSEMFKELAAESIVDFKKILSIPDNYQVLFLPGGGRGQMNMIPMNLLGGRSSAAYVDFGTWGRIAVKEASRYCKVNLVAATPDDSRLGLVDAQHWAPYGDEAYFYYVDNETVNGIEYDHVPNTDGIALVSDMSSNLLSRPFDPNAYDLFFACAQKNLGPAGVTVVVMKDELLERSVLPSTPSIFNYKMQADASSFLNTSPTYPWYMCSLVFKWVLEQGGVAKMDRRAKARSDLLYSTIDASDFYVTRVDKHVRSRMNVVFNLQDESLCSVFVKEADQRGLHGLKGHRSVGGLRASMYNAMPLEGAQALLDFMRDFEARYG